MPMRTTASFRLDDESPDALTLRPPAAVRRWPAASGLIVVGVVVAGIATTSTDRRPAPEVRERTALSLPPADPRPVSRPRPREHKDKPARRKPKLLSARPAASPAPAAPTERRPIPIAPARPVRPAPRPASADPIGREFF
jgi:hypothetical protein